MSSLQSFQQELESILEVQKRLQEDEDSVEQAKENAKRLFLDGEHLEPGQVPSISDEVLQSAEHLAIVLNYYPPQGETWSHPYASKRLQCGINVYGPEDIETKQFMAQFSVSQITGDMYTFLRMNELETRDSSVKIRNIISQMFEGRPGVTSLEATCDLEKLETDYCLTINQPRNVIKMIHPLSEQWEYVTAVLNQHFTNEGIETSEVDLSDKLKDELQTKNAAIEIAEKKRSKTMEEYKTINPLGINEEQALFLARYAGELMKIEEFVNEYTENSIFALPDAAVQQTMREGAISFDTSKRPEAAELQLLNKLAANFSADMNAADLFNLTGRIYEQLAMIWKTTSAMGKFLESRKEHYRSLVQSFQPAQSNLNQ